jgi:hypothetical protein
MWPLGHRGGVVGAADPCVRGAWREGRGPERRFGAEGSHRAWTSGPTPASACGPSRVAARIGARRRRHARRRARGRGRLHFKIRLALFERGFLQIFELKWSER